jgi:hypothetical protein
VKSHIVVSQKAVQFMFSFSKSSSISSGVGDVAYVLVSKAAAGEHVTARIKL